VCVCCVCVCVVCVFVWCVCGVCVCGVGVCVLCVCVVCVCMCGVCVCVVCVSGVCLFVFHYTHLICHVFLLALNQSIRTPVIATPESSATRGTTHYATKLH